MTSPFSAARRVVLFFALMLLAGVVRAQQVPSVIQLSPEDKERGGNGMQKNFFFTTGLGTTEKEYQNAGFFGQKLRPYLTGNQEALDNLNRYRRQKWLFLAERFTFVGALGLYGEQVLAKDSEQQYFNNTQKVAAGVAVFSLLSNVLITRNTNSHFQRAVEAYNAGMPAAHTGMLQRLQPSSVGLAAAPTGRPMLALTWNLR